MLLQVVVAFLQVGFELRPRVGACGTLCTGCPQPYDGIGNPTGDITTTYATIMIDIVMAEIWDFAEIIEAMMCVDVKVFSLNIHFCVPDHADILQAFSNHGDFKGKNKFIISPKL
uniref:Uncharacterized protein n=1 Tax=Glossina austeni TaxID=7395 RepID=A0A1A9UFE2_GLOAU